MNKDSKVTLRTDNKMPIIGLGTWKLTDHTDQAVANALQLGYRMIDTSGDYGSQPGVGEGILLSGMDREDYYLVTKVEETDDAYEATIKNLQELQLDYADLMLIHRPPAKGVGEELWVGLMQAREEGLTVDIGVSNYSESQLVELMEKTGETPVVNQIEWSPFGYSPAMLDFCDRHHIIIQAYSPLTHSNRLNNKVIAETAETYGKSPAQILIRWNLQIGTVPIVKASQHEHQVENLDVFDFQLSAEDMEKLNGLNERYSALGNLTYN